MALKDIFKSKKFYIITVIILTVGIIKLLAIFIYTKDEPKMVPEKAREEVRGGLKEVAEAISVVTPKLSEVLVEAAYTPEKELETDISDWQTYKSDIYGFELRFPENWKSYEGEKIVSYSPSEDSLDQVTVAIVENEKSIADYIDKYFSGLDSEYLVLESKTYGQRIVSRYQQVGGLEELHYVFSKENIIFDFMAEGTGNEYLEKIISSFN